MRFHPPIHHVIAGLICIAVVTASPRLVAAAGRTDWFHEAGWGVMTHYLGAPPSSSGGAELTAEAWNRQVDAVDVKALADQVASTGAGYLLFTIGQNSGHYCAPNAAYDRIVGITPSKCSRRDLVSDLAGELKNRNLRLMVYLPSGAPAADVVARKKLGWRWGRADGWQLPGEPPTSPAPWSFRNCPTRASNLSAPVTSIPSRTAASRSIQVA